MPVVQRSACVGGRRLRRSFYIPRTSLTDEYLFEVGVRAVVRVQASSPDVARKVVETVLRAPGSQEIELANRNNQRVGRDATVTAVDFVQKSHVKLVANERLGRRKSA